MDDAFFSRIAHRRSSAAWAARLLVLVLACAAPAVRSEAQELVKEVISREFSFQVGGIQTPEIKEAVSREASLSIVNGPANPYSQVVSREASIVVTTPNPPPQVTSILVTPSPTGASVTLAWTSYNPWAAADIDHFEIYVSNQPFTSVAGMTPVMIVGGETLQATLTGLTPFQDHSFAVVAVDASGDRNTAVVPATAYVISPQVISREVSLFVGNEPTPPYQQVASREASIVVATPAPPAQVTGFTITASPSGDSVTLNWSNYNQWAQKDVGHFAIYLSDHPFSDVTGMTPFATVPAESTTTTLTGLPTHLDHFLAIVAVDALGNSNPAVIYSAAYILSPQAVSREVSLFTGDEPVPGYRQAVSREASMLVSNSMVPAPVTGLNSGFMVTTSTNAFGSLTFDWTSYNEVAQQDVVRYRIYVSTSYFDDVTGMVPYEYIPAGLQQQTIAKLVGNGIYFGAVVAEDALGNFNPVVRSVIGQASPPSPFAEIAVEQPAGTNLINGSSNDFGLVNFGSSSVPRKFTVTNAGTAMLNISSVTKSGGNAPDFTLDTTAMATTLAPGGSTTFTVTFSPGSGGRRNTTLVITSNASVDNPFEIPLMGTGGAAPKITVEQPAGATLIDGGSSVDFGSVTLGAGGVAKVFTVRNTGAADLTITGVTKTGGNLADFGLVTAGMATTIPPGESTTFSVTFSPGAEGTRTTILQIANNEGDANPFNITLVGSGVKALGVSLQVAPSYEFSIEQGTQQTGSIQLFNPGTASRSATLTVANSHSGLTLSLGQPNPINVGAGATVTVPIVLDAGSMVPVGVYDDLLLEVAVDDGSTLYSNIKVYVVQPGAGQLPDLAVSSADIRAATNADGSVTLTADIHNQGTAPASNVAVQFYDFGSLLNSVTIDLVPANGVGTVSITVPSMTAGDHLIRVVADPAGAIQELDKTNNEASQIVMIGSQSVTEGDILVTGNLPSTVYTNSLFSVAGQAVYAIVVNGTTNTDYVVKGGSVRVVVSGGAGAEWDYGDIYTDINGNFSVPLQAPTSSGTYHVSMTVTDQTFTGTRDLVFSVVAPLGPDTPPPTVTLPSDSWPDGQYVWDPGSGAFRLLPEPWPLPGPVPQQNVYVHSIDIDFSSDNPAVNEEIYIFAKIHYWASSSALVAKNVPVNFYVTYPGSAKVKIGPTVLINEILFNSYQIVFAPWKNTQQGIYIVEVEIDPSYVETYMLDNAATRAIIVGQAQNGLGAISGQVNNPFGGMGNVTLHVLDANGVQIGNAVTDSTGFYLIKDVPPGTQQVSIDTPDGYVAAAQTKTATVAAGSVSTVDFDLTLPPNVPPSVTAASLSPYPVATMEQAIQVVGLVTSDPEGESVSVTYQWQSSPDGVTFADAPGATGATFPASPANAGFYLRCSITPSDAHGTGVPFLTAATAVARQSWQSWLAESFSAQELADPTVSDCAADPDGDGLTNLMEYGMNLDPHKFDSVGRPELVIVHDPATGNDYLGLKFRRHKAPTELTYTVEVTENLVDPASWQPLVPDQHLAEPPASIDANTESVIVRDSVSMSDATQRFIRLRITAPGMASCSPVSQPMGYVTLTCKANSDTVVSVPLAQAPAFRGLISGIPAITGSTATVAFSPAPGWTNNQFAQSYYIRFVSGALSGKAFTIAANDAATLTFDTEGDAVAEMAAGDQIVLTKYWTLNDLFPAASQTTLVQSAGTLDFQRMSELLIPDLLSAGINLAPSQKFFVTPSGWMKDVAGLPDASNQILLPDTYFIVRHPASVTADTTFTSIGVVNLDRAAAPLSTQSSGKQDNFVALQRPVGVRLDQSGLSSGFVPSVGTLGFQRRDELLLFDNTAIARNKAPSRKFFMVGSNWFEDVSGFPARNDFMIEAGIGFIVRKYQTSDGVTSFWINDPNYSNQ